jgi:hypothetical protein
MILGGEQYRRPPASALQMVAKVSAALVGMLLAEQTTAG